jgi:uncharacterized protein (PEP-CTERM system associated)
VRPLRRHAPRLTLAAVGAARCRRSPPTDLWRRAIGQLPHRYAAGAARPEEADLVLSVSPALSAQRRGARASLGVTYIPTLLMYLENRDSNDVQHYLNALFSAEAVENFFFVDASANVRQTFISPFGSVLTGVNINENQTQTATLGLSPYVRGVLGAGYTYLVRNDNFWSTSDTSALDNLYESRVLATFASPLARTLRWDADYEYTYTKFRVAARLRAACCDRADLPRQPELSVNARLGYEVNDYAVDDYSGPIYGAA